MPEMMNFTNGGKTLYYKIDDNGCFDDKDGVTRGQLSSNVGLCLLGKKRSTFESCLCGIIERGRDCDVSANGHLVPYLLQDALYMSTYATAREWKFLYSNRFADRHVARGGVTKI